VNLVVNARDAMPHGGHLTVETADVVLDAGYARTRVGVQPGPHAMLLVRDTGIGMDETVQAHLFEPFFTTKPPGRGTGLGLATAYGTVKQSGGHIAVESQSGAGTTFRIYLPPAEKTFVAPRVRASEVAIPSGTETILLVEDEDVVRAFMCESLRTLGYRVIEARGGPEALLYCQRHPESIDLLLTDVVMPKMSGPQLAEQLGGTLPGLRVLYISGYTDELPLRGGSSLLQKPFTAEQLGSRIRDVLEARV
jgi:two-component system cell cycle sensor histidine kinase/response regulator CckA